MEVSKHAQYAPRNYAEYQKFTDDERWEIIDSVPYSLTPSPSFEHQRIVSNIHGELYLYLKGKTCKVFTAPFDVVLLAERKSDEEIRNVVQPDVAVICDPNKFTKNGCVGSPDLVVEVLSPSTAYKDRTVKLKLYRLAEVAEYWIVDSYHQTIDVYDNKSNRFGEPKVYGKDDRLPVGVLDHLELDLSSIFG